MPELVAPIRVLALDFGGTLALRRGGALSAGQVLTALHGAYPRWVPAPGFASALTRAMKQAQARDRVALRQCAFCDLLAEAAHACGTALPDSPTGTEVAVFDAVPDAVVDDDAADAVRVLAARGYRLLLADNTRWPLAARERTLKAAGVLDCFERLVLSSELGVRKPHGLFYFQILEAAGAPAGQVLFVGDRADLDVEPPRAFGMRAALVAPVWLRESPLGSRPPLFAELPRLLKAAVR